MIQNLDQTVALREEIGLIVDSISPFDTEEIEHLNFVKRWIHSGAELFRRVKPATPKVHLVSYFVVIDFSQKKILLVDHNKARLWLPTGGHVEPNEHPRDTVKREILEELGIEANFILDSPLFATVTKTVGSTPVHTDVSLWYIVHGDSLKTFDYDKDEFSNIRWFDLETIPYSTSDPNMKRFVRKFKSFFHNF